MKRSGTLVACMVFLSLIGHGQSVDYSGVNAFCEVSEKLKASRVTDADWDKLFATPYYKFYEDWGQRRVIHRNLVTAISPLLNKRRDTLLKRNDWNATVLRHIMNAESSIAGIQAYQLSLMKRDIIKESLKLTKRWLPRKTIKKSKTKIKVAFGIAQPDGNANNNSIAIDIMLAKDIDVIRFLAHEAHHFYVYNLRVKLKPADEDTGDILKAIDQLQLEGVADMIDKPLFLETKGKGFPQQLYDNYKRSFEDPMPGLKKVDSLLVATSKDPASVKANGKSIGEALPLGGHPHGYFMALTIRERFGKKALLKTLKNPFDFVRKYNLARPTFSGEAMEYLATIEKSYLLP